MGIKNNESTDLRPDGSRLIDAPLISIYIPDCINQLKSEITWQNSDRNAITIFKTNGLRIVLIAMHEEAVMKKHISEGIIRVQVLEGEIIFGTDNQSQVIKQGQLIVLHKELSHNVKALKESVFLLTLTTTLEV